ncbi:MAG: lytic transglycosylase domain-containing protein [Bacteroidetes bacterium]|nr:lytic transglycosylase domain-containing protein [Bacteroidota bacterium]
MLASSYFRRFIVWFTFFAASLSSSAHDIYFCGEKIPLDDDFVRTKLMNIIKKQINYVNVPSLQQRIKLYMPQVERMLDEANIPQDFKYLAIVESGFKTDVSSAAGARGFWQLMKATAIDWNLVVNDLVDERTDFVKSTRAACREIVRNYSYIRKTFKISSWVLTAAAYNNGTGNIKNAIIRQGTSNYFSMNLNAETAAYVYKIIAIKELYEFPELYMQGFGYNIFSVSRVTNSGIYKNSSKDFQNLGGIQVKVNDADGSHPIDLSKTRIRKTEEDNTQNVTYVYAQIKGKYKHLDKDHGNTVNFILQSPLQVQNNYTAEGEVIQGTAWVIDDRAMIDLGYGHQVIVLDKNSQKGISLSDLKNKKTVILKVIQSPKSK